MNTTGVSRIVGPSSRAILTDRASSARRYTSLARYCRKCLLRQGDFVCPSSTSCHASAANKPGVSFYEGVMSYVGAHYDTRVISANAPFRVLIVPMEDGGHREHVTLDQRRGQVGQAKDLSFRKRNPHMRGVTLGLRLAFGHRLAEDRPGEFLDTQQGMVHLFDAFAMANLTLCSAVGTGTTSSRATTVMRDNCLQHMRATIEVLEPTLIVSQGARLSQPLRSLLNIEKEYGAHVARCRLGSIRFIWVNLHHPTFNWDWIARPYLQNVVAPAIRDGRKRAIRLAGQDN